MLRMKKYLIVLLMLFVMLLIVMDTF